MQWRYQYPERYAGCFHKQAAVEMDAVQIKLRGNEVSFMVKGKLGVRICSPGKAGQHHGCLQHLIKLHLMDHSGLL